MDTNIFCYYVMPQKSFMLGNMNVLVYLFKLLKIIRNTNQEWKSVDLILSPIVDLVTDPCITSSAGDIRDFQLLSIFIMLKGLSRNIFKVNCYILLLLFVPIWSPFQSLLMNFCFHLSFLSVPHGHSCGEWEPITWNLLLCNLLCRSFFIGSLRLRRESSELGNKRCLTHAPGIKGTWWLTPHSCKGYWFQCAHIY